MDHNQRWLISAFIILSTALFVLLHQPPASILIAAGMLNGLILPIALTIMLIAVMNKKLFSDYHHPLWMQIMGWVIVALMTWMSYMTIRHGISEIF